MGRRAQKSAEELRGLDTATQSTYAPAINGCMIGRIELLYWRIYGSIVLLNNPASCMKASCSSLCQDRGLQMIALEQNSSRKLGVFHVSPSHYGCTREP